MDKQNYRVGSTPIDHNGYRFGVGEPVALTNEEAAALPASTVTLDPVQADPPAPPAPPAVAQATEQAPAPAPATTAPETTAEATTDAPKAEAKGKTAKSGEKA